jgi:ribosomal protein S18 acetylase RimI-like enzyme
LSKEERSYLLRPAEEHDAAFLYELFCETRMQEFAPLGLPPAALEPLLTMQFRARNAGYAAQFPQAKTLVAIVDAHPAGVVTVDREADGIRLVDIAVSRAMQGQGLGSQLLGALIAEARERSVPLRLSVRFDNPAMRLYESLGFVRTGGDGMSIAMAIEPENLRQSQAPALDEDGDAEGMSGRWFRRLVGQQVVAQSVDGPQVELTVAAVSALPVFGHGIEAGDSFVVEFHGPLMPVLPPEMTTLTTAAGDQASLFLSPTGPREGVMRYEAVFNRMRRKIDPQG